MEGNSQPITSFKNPLTKNVFGNVVLWDVIGGYLGPGDLKDCRQVCKTFDKMVRDCRRWKEGDFWQLHLNETNWSDPGLSALQVAISTVKVTFSDSGTKEQETEMLHKLSNVFQSMKSLSVESERSMGRSKLKIMGVQTIASLAVILGHSSSNLTTLTLHKEILSILSFTDNSCVLFNTPNVLIRIKGLKIFTVDGTMLRQVDSQEQQQTFFNLLATNLDSLEDLTVITQGKHDFSPFPQMHLRTLLERRAPDMKKLELGEIDLLKISPAGLSHILFPQLTHLSLRVSKSVPQLCEFISNHPPLQSLTIKIRGLLTKALLDVIAEKSENFSSLKLKFWTLEEGLQWDWLSRCNKLTVLSLTNPTFNRWRYRSRGRLNIEDILLSLPNGMKNIAFRSCGWLANLNSRFQLWRVLQDPKFSQLEELSILLLPFVVSFDVLDVIGSRRRFPKLRKLHFSINYNHGELSGEKEFWQGMEDVCLQSVSGTLPEESLMEKLGGSKNLKRLTLRNIPEQTIAPAILERFVKSCKSLETLVISRGSTIGDDPPHRVKTVRYCPELSSALEDEDSDSDADEDHDVYFE